MKFIRGAQGEWLNRRFIRRIYSMRDQATAKKRYLWFALTDTPTEDGTPHELHRNAAISGAEDESLRLIPATVPMNMPVIWWDQDTDDFEIRSYPIIAWRLYGFDQPMIQGYAFPIVPGLVIADRDENDRNNWSFIELPAGGFQQVCFGQVSADTRRVQGRGQGRAAAIQQPRERRPTGRGGISCVTTPIAVRGAPASCRHRESLFCCAPISNSAPS